MPLSGLTVLDLSRYLPGPQAAALLGDYGARVLRVETPRHAAARDKAQGIDLLHDAARDRALATDLAGRNKERRLIDVFTDEGRDAVLRLVDEADVLIHDYRQTAIDSAGLGAVALRARNPRLIHVSVSATGATGPRAGAPGHDPMALALAGVLTRMGETPVFPGFPPADILTAAHTAFAVMVALWRRAQSGEGTTLDAAMSDSALSLMTSVFSRQQRTGTEPPLAFSKGDNAVFATSDGGHVAATNMERPYWDRFCEIVGRLDLKPRFADPDRNGLLDELSTIYAARSRADWDALARQHDLQIAPVLSSAEAMEDAHHHARGALCRVDGIVVPGRPVRIEDLPHPAPRPFTGFTLDTPE